ncbi:MAG TPA: SLOG family protein [Oscillatoriaceae cyanobacterium]
MITIAGTGHRPDKLGEIWYPGKWTPAIAVIKQKLAHYGHALRVISGMMIGFDLMLAEACAELKAEGVPVRWVAALAYEGQEEAWHHDAAVATEWYRKLLQLADERVVVSRECTREAFELRARWMVEEANAVLACWDGSPGGTGATLELARAESKPVVNIYPEIRQALGF